MDNKQIENHALKYHGEFQALKLYDDFLFSKVMGDPEICRITLEKILDIPIREVRVPTTEHVINLLHGSRGVRLDVYVADEEGNVYNCEMQAGRNVGQLPRRSRYYHGCIDLDLLMKGASYQELTKAFVIFICTADPFGQGRHIYTFRNVCDEVPGLLLGDESCTIFLNTKGTADDVSAEVKEFLRYVEDSTDAFADQAKSEWVRQVHRQVRKVKDNTNLEVEFMTLNMKLAEIHEEGREESAHDINRLNSYLLKNNMHAELERSISNRDYQKELMEIYHDQLVVADGAVAYPS